MVSPRTTGIASLVCVLTMGTAVAHAGQAPLGGPDVAANVERASLVSLGFEGGVLPLGAPPAIAALDLITLDEPTEAELHALLGERAQVMDSVVLDNITLLSQVETVMSVGSPAEKLRTVQQGLAALEPARAWGTLSDRIAAVLPGPTRARFVMLLDEYEEARYTHALETGAVDHRFEHRMARYWEDIIWEIERAAERVFEEDGEGDEWLERLTVGLDLTPMQVGEIRQMGEDFYFETKTRPTKEQEMAFIAEIRTVMTVEQRWKFTAMMLRGELDPDADD